MLKQSISKVENTDLLRAKRLHIDGFNMSLTHATHLQNCRRPNHNIKIYKITRMRGFWSGIPRTLAVSFANV